MKSKYALLLFLLLLPSIGMAQNGASPKAKEQAAADQKEVMIVQALDQKTDLELKDVPIRDALTKLSEKTGIPIELATGAVGYLPYGSETKLSATIQGQPLRESLTALLRPVGLRFVLGKDRIGVVPAPALVRLAHRATWQELATLEMLETKPWSKELFESLHFQFQDSSSDDLAANLLTLRKLCEAVGAGSAAEVLELATDRYGWTWYPTESFVVVLSKPRQIERQLEKRVSLEYAQASLKDALLDLGGQTGVLVRLDPGVLATLPTGTVERFSLAVENTTVRQVLEVIAGQTGLSYFIEPDGLRFTTVSATPGSTGQAAVQVEQTAQATVTALRANSIVGQINIPNKDGTSFSYFLRELDLPPEVNEMRKAKIREKVERMRQELQATSRPKD